MRLLKKILLPLFAVVICYGLFAFFPNHKERLGNTCVNPVRFYQDDYYGDLDSLRMLYAQNKSFMEEYEKQCLIALSYYPELKECTIKFVYENISTTMSCRPVFQSLLYGEREYQIFINDYPDFEGILLKDVSFNAQIGVIGHEIAHIVDYEQRNIAGVIQRGISYLTADAKREYEREIDLLTIKQGLGWQLYAWANFSMYQSTKATEEYKQFKRETYMSPTEIENVIKVTDCYNYTIETK